MDQDEPQHITEPSSYQYSPPPIVVDENDDTPAFLFAVAEPEQKSGDGKLKLSYWSYKITSDVSTCDDYDI